MRILATLANGAWLAGSVPARRRFESALADPGKSQLELLTGLLRRDSGSSYGSLHGFGDIRGYRDYASRAPLVAYDDLVPWIDRIRAGETRVLQEDPVSHLVPTSGSTGAVKLIPFSASLQRGFNAALGPWMLDLFRVDPGIAFGPAYWSVTPVAQESRHGPSKVPIGFDDDAGYLGGLRSALVKAAMAVPSAVREAQGIDSFRRMALRHLLLARDLRLVSVWHPSFLSLLLEGLKPDWESLLAEIDSGGTGEAQGFPPAAAWSMRRPPNPRRAAELRGIGPEYLEAIWPELRLISCWGDSHSAQGLSSLGRLFPGARVQPKGLLATECVVTLPYRGKYPLAVNSHFFEFIDERGEILVVDQLRLGGVYEVVVTTGGGLWRYRLGDLVEVVGFLGATPSLRFLGRARHVSDRFGEKLSEAFVGRALARIWEQSPVRPEFALLAPEEESPLRSHYTLFVEDPSPVDLASRLDLGLRENPQYSYCRDLGQLGPPRVFRIRGKGYKVYAEAEALRGARLGDIKPSSLSGRTDWSRQFQGDYVEPE